MSPTPSSQENLRLNAIDPGTRIGHVHLKVADLDRALAFYCGVLGFELQQRMGRGAAFVAAGGYHHHLGLNTWHSAGSGPPAPGSVGLRHYEVQLPDAAELAAVVDRVHAAGIDTAHAPGGTLVRDPSGIGVLLTAR